MTSDHIKRIDTWLQTNRPEYYKNLNNGINDNELDAFEQRFTLKLPEDFRTFYKWRNGQSTNYFKSIQENRIFLPLSEISETKDMLDGMIGYDFEDPEWWRTGWVPFLSNGGGDYLCLDLLAEDGGQPGQVISYWHDWEDRSVEYNSFQLWLSDLADSMENGTLEIV